MLKNIQLQTFDVIILGAGAAGLMAAKSASDRGRKVLILEKSNMPGKKILMSGGGKCNFTNIDVRPENFISENPHFSTSAISRYEPEDFIYLVNSHGIPFEERSHGQLFCKGSSREILDMLLTECAANMVHIQTNFETLEVSKYTADSNNHDPRDMNASGFLVRGVCREKGSEVSVELYSQSLIVATGGLSIPTLGGSSFGYKLAKKFGIRSTPVFAGLVPFIFADKHLTGLKDLAGVSVQAEITCGNQKFRESLLFTHKGISGPVVLQISNYWSKSAPIHINLFPDKDIESELNNWILETPNKLFRSRLKEYLPRSLVSFLEESYWFDYKNTPIKKIPDIEFQKSAVLLSHWKLWPDGTEGYKTAEVTVGGVDTNLLSSKTFESQEQPGLYFIGEVLDVTGHLGGFNFHWAWSSGHAAGSYA